MKWWELRAVWLYIFSPPPHWRHILYHFMSMPVKFRYKLKKCTYSNSFKGPSYSVKMCLSLQCALVYLRRNQRLLWRHIYRNLSRSWYFGSSCCIRRAQQGGLCVYAIDAWCSDTVEAVSPICWTFDIQRSWPYYHILLSVASLQWLTNPSHGSNLATAKDSFQRAAVAGYSASYAFRATLVCWMYSNDCILITLT